jgi:hypothetical protein
MTSNVPHSIDVRLYRACLRACPPAFRREYGDEMVRDFGDARAEAAATGGRALRRLRLLIALDLLRTVGTQWTRTGWPVIGLVSVVATLTLAAGLAAVGRHAAFVIPPDAAHAETIAVLVLATTSVFLIAMTIALTLWAARPIRRRRR